MNFLFILNDFVNKSQKINFKSSINDELESRSINNDKGTVLTITLQITNGWASKAKKYIRKSMDDFAHGDLCIFSVIMCNLPLSVLLCITGCYKLISHSTNVGTG